MADLSPNTSTIIFVVNGLNISIKNKNWQRGLKNMTQSNAVYKKPPSNIIIETG